MASRLADSVIDNGLASLKSAARYVYICSAEPQSYTEASSTYKLGTKDFGAGNVFPNAIEAASAGRSKRALGALSGALMSASKCQSQKKDSPGLLGRPGQSKTIWSEASPHPGPDYFTCCLIQFSIKSAICSSLSSIASVCPLPKIPTSGR
jgi:hypothetical protein